jgi:hypothetical protein
MSSDQFERFMFSIIIGTLFIVMFLVALQTSLDSVVEVCVG